MRNPVWMEPQTNYRIKLSVDNLRTSAVALEIIRKIISKGRTGLKVLRIWPMLYRRNI